MVGTGLGMPIVKSLVTAMGGDIYVESEQNKGTVFTIVLPFTVVGTEGDKPRSGSGTRGADRFAGGLKQSCWWRITRSTWRSRRSC